MKELEIQRLKAALIYILSNMPAECRDVYHIVKTAFYAQKEHLIRYALPLFNDKIVALQFGPVPSLIYNILRVARGETAPYRFCDDRVLARISESIDYNEEIFSTSAKADMECLSRSNVECLNIAIGIVSKMGFGQLMNRTHGDEWYRAFHSANHEMNDLNIAKEGGASDDVLEYLADSLKLDKMIDGNVVGRN